MPRVTTVWSIRTRDIKYIILHSGLPLVFGDKNTTTCYLALSIAGVQSHWRWSISSSRLLLLLLLLLKVSLHLSLSKGLLGLDLLYLCLCLSMSLCLCLGLSVGSSGCSPGEHEAMLLRILSS